MSLKLCLADIRPAVIEGENALISTDRLLVVLDS